MKKQSSIEWIEGYLKKFNYIEESLALRKAFEEAKKMHKQEIENAYDEGVYLAMTPSKTSDDYYKNTYEKEN